MARYQLAMWRCAPPISHRQGRGVAARRLPRLGPHMHPSARRALISRVRGGWLLVGGCAPHRTVHHIVLLQRTSPASTRVALGVLRTSAMLTYSEAGGGTSIAAGYSTIGPRTVHHTGARASVHTGWRGVSLPPLPPPPFPYHHPPSPLSLAATRFALLLAGHTAPGWTHRTWDDGRCLGMMPWQLRCWVVLQAKAGRVQRGDRAATAVVGGAAAATRPASGDRVVVEAGRRWRVRAATAPSSRPSSARSASSGW